MSFSDFQTQFQVEAKPRTVIIIIMAVLALVIGIISAVLGSKYGDENCECISPSNSGFRAFAIAMLAVGIPLMIVSFIFFGCTTG